MHKIKREDVISYIGRCDKGDLWQEIETPETTPRYKHDLGWHITRICPECEKSFQLYREKSRQTSNV